MATPVRAREPSARFVAVGRVLADSVDQVIELSLKFQILTPYTAFYADPNDPNSAVEDKEEAVPNGFVLHQNYPNPFNPSTTIRYELPSDGFVTLKICDLSGRLLRVLVSASEIAGEHAVLWDGTDDAGFKVAAGIYLYQLEFADRYGERQVLVQKMSLVK